MNANASVSAILSEKHGIAAHPGAKVECPFCHRRTFSIKRDDTLGKCFHPACGAYVTSAQFEAGHGNVLFRVLEQVFGDFHRTLLDLGEATYRNAYSYCVEERRIHPRVVADSMLGAVPSGYDVAARFAPHIQDAEAAIKAEDEAKKRPGRPRRDAGPTSQERLVFLTAARDKLANCIRGCAGWLAFFYTDAAHCVVAVRFREPYTKRITFFKPTKIGGVFNHGLFTPYESPGQRHLDDLLLVVEGEFNQLQLQSLCVRVAEAEGRPPESGYVFACAVGGVNNADVETIRRLARTPVICYDHDTSGAGFALVEKVRLTMSVTAFTPPRSDSDLDDFIRSFGQDDKAAREAVKFLVSRRKPYARCYKGVAAEIFAARQKQGAHDTRREFEVNAQVAAMIRADLHDRGRFYHDGRRAYFFSEVEKKLVEIQPDETEFNLMLARYGINRAELIHRYLREALQVEAFEHGKRTEVCRLAYYNHETFTVYLFNQKDQVYRISPEAIDLVDNGTDGVMFLNETNAQAFEASGRIESSSLLEGTIVSKINFAEDLLTTHERSLLFTFWFYSLFFESIMPTKPILALIGPKGSGKSITARKVGMLLFGKNFNTTSLTDDPKDFDAAVTNSAFVAIDNADSKCTWLNDRLATIATGGSIKKRELYTTNRLVEIPVRCFLVIASRTPHFRRDDVTDRLLIMKVDRFTNFKPEKILLAEVIQNRDQIMAEVIHQLQEVVRALRDGRDTDYSGVFRMGDFADFAVKVARHAGEEEQVKAIFSKLIREQSSFTLESDPVFDLLWAWAANNRGREITNADLCRELAELAEKTEIPFRYKGKARAFAQRMSNLRANLSEFFIITERPAGARKKLFTFMPKLEEKDK